MRELDDVFYIAFKPLLDEVQLLREMREARSERGRVKSCLLETYRTK